MKSWNKLFKEVDEFIDTFVEEQMQKMKNQDAEKIYVKLLNSTKEESKQECSTCKYFKSGSEPGLCKRHAPVILRPGDIYDTQQYPHVSAHDWCGDYKKKS